MPRELHPTSPKTTHRRRNFAAAMVAGGSIAFLYYSFQPATAEENMPRRTARLSSLTVDVDHAVDSAAIVKSDVVPAPHDASDAREANPDQTAIEQIVSQLERGIDHLERVPSYTAIFEREERIDGEMKEPQQMELKLRHAPFSVYMKWLNGDKGRELLYTANENDGRMLVKLGGWKGNLLPTLKLDPHSERAKTESRHPVTQAGLVNLAREIIHHRQRDLKTGVLPKCSVTPGLLFEGRRVTKLEVEYDSQSNSSVYRKAITLIDEELNLPVYVENYTWPNQNTKNLDEETLVERYAYTEIRIEDQLADAIWDHGNPDYRFTR